MGWKNELGCVVYTFQFPHDEYNNFVVQACTNCFKNDFQFPKLAKRYSLFWPTKDIISYTLIAFPFHSTELIDCTIARAGRFGGSERELF